MINYNHKIETHDGKYKSDVTFISIEDMYQSFKERYENEKSIHNKYSLANLSTQPKDFADE